jgi:hypothetical protein
MNLMALRGRVAFLTRKARSGRNRCEHGLVARLKRKQN